MKVGLAHPSDKNSFNLTRAKYLRLADNIFYSFLLKLFIIFTGRDQLLLLSLVLFILPSEYFSSSPRLPETAVFFLHFPTSDNLSPWFNL